jgi:hypothetical protein
VRTKADSPFDFALGGSSGRRRRKANAKETAKAGPPLSAKDDNKKAKTKNESNSKNKNNSKSKMRGSLRCATHDETVSGFGRDDAVCFLDGEKGESRFPIQLRSGQALRE